MTPILKMTPVLKTLQLFCLSILLLGLALGAIALPQTLVVTNSSNSIENTTYTLVPSGPYYTVGGSTSGYGPALIPYGTAAWFLNPHVQYSNGADANGGNYDYSNNSYDPTSAYTAHGGATGTVNVATPPAAVTTVFSFNGTGGSDPSANTSVWGSEGGNNGGIGSFGGSDTTLRGTFTGTEMDWYNKNPSSPNGGNNVSIDGGPFAQVPTASTSNQWSTLASGLTDSVHTYVITTYYGDGFGYDPAFRVTGAAPAMGKTANPAGTAGVDNVIEDGDSRTFGQAASAPGNSSSGTSYPADLMAALGANHTGHQQGIPGAPYSTGIAAFANNIATQYGASYKSNVVIDGWGYNDLGGGQTTAQLEASTIQYINQAHAAHFKVVKPTIPDGATSPSRFLAYNTWLKSAGNPSGADAIADVAGDANLQQYPPSSTYWYSDNIHFTDAGYKLIEQDILPAYYKVVPPPLSALTLSAALSGGHVALTFLPTGGTLPITYTYYRAVSLGTAPATLGTNTTGSFIDATAAVGQTYYYTATATDSAGSPVTLTTAPVGLMPASATFGRGRKLNQVPAGRFHTSKPSYCIAA